MSRTSGFVNDLQPQAKHCVDVRRVRACKVFGTTKRSYRPAPDAMGTRPKNVPAVVGRIGCDKERFEAGKGWPLAWDGEASTEIVPEGDTEFDARVHQAKEGIAAFAPSVIAIPPLNLRLMT
jgi:hypothetical protein